MPGETLRLGERRIVRFHTFEDAHGAGVRFGAVCRDMGGDVSTAELQIIRSACGLAILREALDARILKDEPIDIAVYATITNALRRQFETIGLKRVAHDVTPTLEEYVRTTYGDESPSITGGETPTFDRDGPIPEASSSSSISDEDGNEEE